MKKKNKTLTNKEIRASRVIVINPNGDKLGEFLTNDAINLAQEKGLDLVQVNDSSKPICKIMDYGKYQYDQKKKSKRAKAASANVKTKEIQLRPKTEENDIQTLVNRAKKFLKKGHKVKITVKYRGREGAHLDLVRNRCLNVYERLNDVSKIDQSPKKLGRQFTMVISPL